MDALAKLHWEMIVQEHIDPNSEEAKEAKRRFQTEGGKILDDILNGIFAEGAVEMKSPTGRLRKLEPELQNIPVKEAKE